MRFKIMENKIYIPENRINADSTIEIGFKGKLYELVSMSQIVEVNQLWISPDISIILINKYIEADTIINYRRIYHEEGFLTEYSIGDIERWRNFGIEIIQDDAELEQRND